MLGYRSQVQDPATQIVLMNTGKCNRPLDTLSGRFMSISPIDLFEQPINVYLPEMVDVYAPDFSHLLITTRPLEFG